MLRTHQFPSHRNTLTFFCLFFFTFMSSDQQQKDRHQMILWEAKPTRGEVTEDHSSVSLLWKPAIQSGNSGKAQETGKQSPVLAVAPPRLHSHSVPVRHCECKHPASVHPQADSSCNNSNKTALQIAHNSRLADVSPGLSQNPFKSPSPDLHQYQNNKIKISRETTVQSHSRELQPPAAPSNSPALHKQTNMQSFHLQDKDSEKHYTIEKLLPSSQLQPHLSPRWICPQRELLALLWGCTSRASCCTATPELSL